MKIQSKSTATTRLTKRETKKVNGYSAAVLASRKAGSVVGEYIGKPPVYINVYQNNPVMPAHYIKVSAGIPFVRAQPK